MRPASRASTTWTIWRAGDGAAARCHRPRAQAGSSVAPGDDGRSGLCERPAGTAHPGLTRPRATRTELRMRALAAAIGPGRGKIPPPALGVRPRAQARWRILRIASSCATAIASSASAVAISSFDVLFCIALQRGLAALPAPTPRRDPSRGSRCRRAPSRACGCTSRNPPWTNTSSSSAWPGILMRTAPGLICVSSGVWRG